MSFWSGDRLLEALPKLITPFDATRIDCAAYTLRVGAEVYVSPTSRQDALTRTRETLDDKQGFVIPPGQFAFLLTEEIITVPDSALAFISMKARIKFKGLINVSGFHVDPGYTGRLVFAVFNAGPTAVHLARGDDCFLIWYASLDRESQFVRKTPPIDGIVSGLITPITGEVQSLASLSHRIDRVETDQRVITTTAGIGISLLLVLIGALIGALIAIHMR